MNIFQQNELDRTNALIGRLVRLQGHEFPLPSSLEGREFESRSIRKGFCEFGAQSIDDCLLTQLEHTLHMLLPMGRQVVRSRLAVILDTKELATQFLRPFA